MSNYELLVEKLDVFIRKYYKVKLIRGIFLFIALMILYLLIASILEYFAYFNSFFRGVLLYSFLIFSSYFLVFLIGFPLISFFKIGKRIDYFQASKIISNHFNHLQDKLINTLELHSLESISDSSDLVLASIDKRIDQIKLLPFQVAIDQKERKKAIFYFLVAFSILSLIYLIYPKVITTSSTRILNYSVVYSKPAPFSFIVKNSNFDIQKGQDFDLAVKIVGSVLPDRTNIVIAGNSFAMNKLNKSNFAYKILNINNSLKFHLEGAGFVSQQYEIKVLPSPVLLNFTISVIPPAYTGYKEIIQQNVGDLNIPQGSVVKWNFMTNDVDQLSVQTEIENLGAKMLENDNFTIQSRIFKSSFYSISVSNKFFNKKNVLSFAINVLPDLFPEIQVVQKKDSLNFNNFYFYGKINDDYGFSNLVFKYKVLTGSKNGDYKSGEIKINKNLTSQDFFYGNDFSNLKLTEGQSVEYYFEVLDNDIASGFKSSKSALFTFSIPSLKQLDSIQSSSATTISDNISKSKKLIEQIQKDIQKLQQSAIDNNVSSWEKTKILKELGTKQVQLQQLIDEMNKVNNEKNSVLNSLTDQKDLLEKQKQIQELMQNLVSDDLKKLLDEIKKLQENFDKPKFDNLSDKLKLNYDDLNKQLDRNLELLKKYRVEEMMNSAVNDLKDLEKKENNLANSLENKSLNEKEGLEEQQKVNDQFNDLKEKLQDANKKNEELKNPLKLDNVEKDLSDISQSLSESEDNLSNGKEKKAIPKQRDAGKQMKDLAKKLEDQLKKNEKDELELNEEVLRQILDNLIIFSFEQEALGTKLSQMQKIDPKYVEILNKQKDIEDDFKILEDSLISLQNQTPLLKKPISTEIVSIKYRLKNTLKNLSDRNVYNAKTEAQFVMASSNNLALLLSEVLNQMQNQMSSNSSSSGSKKKKPSKGKLSEMRQQQQSLKSQLENMLKQMKDNQGKPGSEGSKQLAKMLAQQEIFSQMLNDLKKSGNLNGDAMKQVSEAKQLLEKNISDLINKNVTIQTINRQNDIITKLLQAENAEREQDQEEKRESKEGRELNKGNISQKNAYKNSSKIFNENFSVNQVQLQNFYKIKYKNYLNKINSK